MEPHDRHLPRAMTDQPIAENRAAPTAHDTSFRILLAISFCHLINDMMQALFPAIYPNLRAQFHLSFQQVGLITLVFQCTAAILQPAMGFAADKRPMPFSLTVGALFTFTGLVLLGLAPNYLIVLLAALLVGLGSAVFHPESSRVARMASGGRYGLAQSLFQVGGNAGSAAAPLAAALLVGVHGRSSIAWYGALGLLGAVILYRVGVWYRSHGLARLRRARGGDSHGLPSATVARSVGILLLLIFSKYFYLTSITSYFTFYLIHTFGVSVQVAQLHLFLFLFAVAAGTLAGGPLGDRFGRKYVIWFSILGMLPFTLLLPYANLLWTGVLATIIGFVMASAFPAIVVYAQELLPGRVGMISGLFFGFAFGMAGIGAWALGLLADATSITFVYKACAFLPLIGLLTVFLPNLKKPRA
jgi:FSR family fosmidomycin resistance protein-like MFS transporter